MAYLVNITSRAGAIWCSCIVKINAENSRATLKYRVLDKQKRVEVLHIRHGARRKPKA